MPATRERSESPFQYNRSRSVSPVEPDPGSKSKQHANAAGPSKKPRLGPADIQRLHVEKLLRNPAREVAMPQASSYKPLKPPPEMVKNINGSASGAGSGEFHVYKHARKREHERLKQMEQKARDLEEQQAFQARQAEREAAANAKTAKNRAKRMKRKQGGKKGGAGEGGAEGGEAAEPKRKLAGGGAGVVFGGTHQDSMAVSTNGKAAEEVQEEDSSDEGDVGPTLQADSGVIQVPKQEAAQVAKEAEIVIHDDD